MSKERGAYLESQEQLILASKVNKLCELTSEDEITPEILKEAKNIIDVLEPRTRPSSNLRIESVIETKGRKEKIVGSTGFGQETINMETDNSREFNIGKVDKYRVGSYVVKKLSMNGLHTLDFTPFWDESSKILFPENPPAIFYLACRVKGNDLVAIGRLHEVIKRFGPLIAVYENNEIIWGANMRGGLQSIGF